MSTNVRYKIYFCLFLRTTSQSQTCLTFGGCQIHFCSAFAQFCRFSAQFCSVYRKAFRPCAIINMKCAFGRELQIFNALQPLRSAQTIEKGKNREEKAR